MIAFSVLDNSESSLVRFFLNASSHMEGTQRSVERTASYDGLDFTVHNFISPSSTAARKDLLALGQKVIQSAKTSSPDWLNPKPIPTPKLSTSTWSADLAE